jgi:hypothetical protein
MGVPGFGHEAGVMNSDQVGEHFGVGVGFESMALGGELAFEDFEVLDDPVMDEDDSSTLVEVRVRVFVRGRAMGGPAGVADAEGASEGIGLEEAGEALIDLALALAELELIVLQSANAGAVIAAILEATQSFKDDWAGWLFADVTYDATHNSIAIVGERVHPNLVLHFGSRMGWVD